ncbi:MAG: nitroreductase [Gammaproteobacteria bacterium]|nr:nitroreductase [Gammaproteobacteria bacterium]
MSTLEFLQQRTSIPAKLLTEPAPNRAELREMIKAAVAAPDHAALQPWRFILIEGEARRKLGDIFADATRAREPDMDEEKIERQREKPLRAPMIITVVCKITENHPKTPEIEQLLSAGAAAQQLMLAANALGYDAIWLTGPNSADETVKTALGITRKDRIVGFIYLGTSSIAKPNVRRPEPDAFLESWPG